MANFELRIYVISAENIDEVIESNGIHDISDLTDTQFVEVAEELGTVYSFNKFLGLDVIAFDKDHVRAYFIDKDNENTPPIPADRHNTVDKENTRRIHLDELLENPNKYTLYELTPFTVDKLK